MYISASFIRDFFRPSLMLMFITSLCHTNFLYILFHFYTPIDYIQNSLPAKTQKITPVQRMQWNQVRGTRKLVEVAVWASYKHVALY